MQQSSIIIINKSGLHARASAKLVALASTYQCNIQIKYADKPADGKSIMSLLMLAAGVGSQLQLITEGEDEDEALQAIEELISKGFDEKS